MTEQEETKAQKTVLVVEDCEETRHILTAVLENMLQVRVVTARDGAVAVEMALQHQPALIIMDLDLPVLDGCEATRRIRLQKGNGDVPIIALSAHGWKADLRDEATASGCDRVLESRGDFSWVEDIARPLIERERAAQA